MEIVTPTHGFCHKGFWKLNTISISHVNGNCWMISPNELLLCHLICYLVLILFLVSLNFLTFVTFLMQFAKWFRLSIRLFAWFLYVFDYLLLYSCACAITLMLLLGESREKLCKIEFLSFGKIRKVCNFIHWVWHVFVTNWILRGISDSISLAFADFAIDYMLKAHAITN